MSDKKISQLTGATTPLAGTEVLPIVQSSTTVKVATDDLTVKNIRSNATSGILQIAGPAAAATRTMTVPDANFTAARTDASNSFTGDQTLATGNLVIGTAGKGIDFSADPSAAGMTSELLDDYEEGAWTPAWSFATSGSVTLGSAVGSYTKIGRVVCAYCSVSSTAISSPTGQAKITGLPFTAATASGVAFSLVRRFATSFGADLRGEISGTEVYFYIQATDQVNAAYLEGSGFSSGVNYNQLRFQIVYEV
jgi:hypothetical protein